MRPARKLAIYAVLLLAVLGISIAAGNAAAPMGLATAEPAAAEHGGAMERGALPGLAAAAEGLRLDADTDTLPAGRPATYRFRIAGDDGPVTAFGVEHTKRMHLIVVRRDFAGFVHTHPTMAPDGTWTARFTLAQPGTYRVFADFVVDGEKRTLATDLFAPGDFQPTPVPAPSRTAGAGGGYTVELSGQPVAGEESALEFVVRRHGRVITDLPTYLGARGHLVALRDGDLAYLHVHADEDRLSFAAEFPTPGTYRLFLQFRHGGTVHTAAFTVDAKEATR